MCAVILAVAQMVVGLETNDNAVTSHFLETIVDKRVTTVTISLPPNDEIWYTSTTHDIISLENYPYKLVSNTYKDGIGKYKFDIVKAPENKLFIAKEFDGTPFLLDLDKYKCLYLSSLPPWAILSSSAIANVIFCPSCGNAGSR